MRRSTARQFPTLFVLLALVGSGTSSGPGGHPSGREHERPPASVLDRYGKLPLSFEPNVGQAAPGIAFVARARGYHVKIAPTEALLVADGPSPDRTAEVRMGFAGADSGARAAPLEPLPGRVNYLVSDPTRRRTDVPTYAKVAYEGVYEGIDVRYYGNAGHLEYDLVVAPGADPGRVRLVFAGAARPRVDRDGDLVLTVAGGELVQKAPVAFQDAGGHRQRVEARYVLTTGGEVAFRLGTYDRSRPLVIDPVLVYSTFLGGFHQDSPTDVAVDSSGSAYVVGHSESSDYPVRAPLQTARGGLDVVVSKLNPAGSALVYSTYLGGGATDIGTGIEVDSTGAAYLSGLTSSTDFPVAAAMRPTNAGGTDAFVAKLSPSGSALVYSTYLGGSADDSASGIAIDSGGNAYVAGTTASTNFPTRNPLQPANGGETDAFVAKLNASGSALVYSTYLGGDSEDAAGEVDVDASASAIVAGETESSNFPIFAPVQPSLRGYSDAFVSRLNPAGSALLYSTYLGGTGYVYPYYSREGAYAVAADEAGNAYVTGLTETTDFPTHNPLAPTSGNGYDAFITKLTPEGAFVYSTYLGAAGSESGRGIAVDSSGSAYITGNVFGEIPIKDPAQGINAGSHDAFVTKVSPDGSALVYSTYLGGTGNDHGWGIAVDATGAAYVAGDTESDNFPVRNAVQPTRVGGYDIFVAKLSAGSPVPQFQGTTRYPDGTTATSAAAGTRIVASGSGAVPNVAYRLTISSDDRCADTVGVLNPTPTVAGADGSVAPTEGTVPATLPQGTYWICFKDDANERATAPATFTVLPPPAIQGRTHSSDGQVSPGGPRGTWLSAFALGARPGVAYRMVLSFNMFTGEQCGNTAVVLNPRSRFANSRGLISTTSGVIPPGTPRGPYQLCFKDDANTWATAPVPVYVT